jgi:hypothetical protein
MAKPTKAGSEVLVQLLARETNGVLLVEASEFNQRVLDKLAEQGFVEYAVSLTDEGRRAAHGVVHPGEGA